MLAEGLAPTRRYADLQERAAQLKDAEANEVLLDGVLLCLTGGQGDDQVLRHGLELARRQHAVAFGLLLPGQDEAAGATVRRRFDAACQKAEVEGQLATSPAQTVREMAREVQARAKYVDVVVVPSGGPLTEALLRRCPKPLVVASDRPAGVSRPLLAYDGGAKANEALFALAYLSLSRGLKPVVLHVERRGRGLDLAPLGPHQDDDGERRAERGEPTVPRGKAEDSSLARAGDYLEGLGIKAELVTAYGPVAVAIAQTAEDHGCDVIFLGSHSRLRWLEEALGGVLDELIQRTQLPLVVT
jgi:nucleotide-binding universal stress UspA family protein